LDSLFKKALEDQSRRRWDAEETYRLYMKDTAAFTMDSLKLQLRILNVKEPKTQEELEAGFLGLYGALSKREEAGYPLQLTHMDAAFKLMNGRNKRGVLKAYLWMEEIVRSLGEKVFQDQLSLESRPHNLLRFTFMQCLVTVTGQQPDNVLRQGIQYANESPVARASAVKIAAMIRNKARQLGFVEADRQGLRRKDGSVEACNIWDEYHPYLLKAMMEDEDPSVRAECVKAVSLDAASLEFLVAKTLDPESAVRLEAYKKLLTECQ